MANPIHNLNDLLETIEGASIETSAGRYVRVDHVKKLLEKQAEAQEKAELEKLEEPPPKTMVQAREQAKRYMREEMGITDNKNIEAGRSIPASDSHSPSRA